MKEGGNMFTEQTEEIEVFEQISLTNINDNREDDIFKRIEQLLNAIIKQNNNLITLSIYDKNGNFFKNIPLTEVCYNDGFAFEFSDNFIPHHNYYAIILL
jgi:hypothetical protein